MSGLPKITRISIPVANGGAVGRVRILAALTRAVDFVEHRKVNVVSSLAVYDVHITSEAVSGQLDMGSLSDGS